MRINKTIVTNIEPSDLLGNILTIDKPYDLNNLSEFINANEENLHPDNGKCYLLNGEKVINIPVMSYHKTLWISLKYGDGRQTKVNSKIFLGVENMSNCDMKDLEKIVTHINLNEKEAFAARKKFMNK